MDLKQKMRLHYTGVVLLVLAMVATFYFVNKGSSKMDGDSAEYLKSILYLVNLIGIPLSFGWLGVLQRFKVNNPWNFRFWFLLILNVINLGCYYVAAEKSLFFVLLIGAGMFLLNKPMEQPIIEEDED